jgi:hypothetical protein
VDPRTLNKLRFHLNRIAHGASAALDDDWSALARLVAEALAQAPTSDSVELRRLLEAQSARLRDRLLVENVYALQRELERVAHSGAYRAPRERAALTPVEQVAELLRGRTLLVIGGDPRREHAERLRRAFELAEVTWPETSETKPSIASFEPYVARPEVAVVLLLIKFNRHGVTEELPDVCERHGKPVVRLVGGYHPEQVAAQILNQVGKRLGGSAG